MRKIKEKRGKELRKGRKFMECDEGCGEEKGTKKEETCGEKEKRKRGRE